MKFIKLAEVVQPNKPKPTTVLPDNLEWSWDPNAADWVAVLKDNQNVTPPLYNPNNQNLVNQNTTSYMSNIKSASSEIVDKNGKKAEEGMWLYKPMNHSTFRGGIPLRLFQVKIRHQKDGTDKAYLLSENKLITKGISHIKDGILFDTYEEAKQYSESHKTKEEKEFDKLDDWQKTDYYLSKQSSCLAKFLDGPQYSKEIKIEAGLIKDGLVKYAGFDFNRGTKYAITTKGLEILRKASEAEHNEALNEREKLAYLFGFNTDEVSTLDTTGKTIKSDKKLNTKSLVNKLYNEIKKNKDNWEDVDDLSQYTHIDTKEEDNGIMVYVRTELSYDEMMKLAEILNKVVQKFDSLSYFEPLQPGIMQAYIENKKSASLNKYAKQWTICEADGTELGEVVADSELDAKVKFGIEHSEYADSQSICAKEIKAKKLPLYKQKDPYYSDEAQISLFKTSINDVKRNFEQIAGIPLKQFCLIYKENNNEEFKKIYDKITDYISKKYNYNVKSMQWFHSFCDMIEKQCNKKDAQYEQTTNTKEPYPNPSETPITDVILENHDGWVNTAAEKRPYTEEEKRLLPLFKLLNQHVAKKEIQLVEDPQKDGNIVATGQAEVINDLEHEVKDLGFHCEPIAEITDEDYIGYDIYSLRIFTK